MSRPILILTALLLTAAQVCARVIHIPDDFDEDTVIVALIGSALSVSEFILHPSSLILSVSPNPFNVRTAVHFTLPRPERVELGLFSLSGRAVRRLAVGDYPAGRHAVSIAGDDLPSGVYVVTLGIGSGERRSAKLVLMR